MKEVTVCAIASNRPGIELWWQVYQHIPGFPPTRDAPAPPGEPWGAPGSGGIYNPSSKSLAFTSTFAFKEGQPGGNLIRQPDHILRLLSIRQGAAALLQSPSRRLSSSSFHLQGRRKYQCFFPHETEIDSNFQMNVSS